MVQKKHLLLFLSSLLGLQWMIPSLQASETDRCYIFAYFTDKNENRNGLHLAWSEDGYSWHPIGDEHSFLKCDYGTWYADKKMRDPFIMKGEDGLWHCIWTLNWEGCAIGHAASPDLINWSRQSYPDEMKGFEVRNCWAPEMIYDRANDQYVIFWASTIKENGVWKTEPGEKYDHRMYYTTTRDFKTYADPQLFFDPGHNVIDASICEKDGQYYMIYKDERIYPEPRKELLVAVSDAATGPYVPTGQPPFATDWVEGPAVCVLPDSSYLVIYDAYTKHRYEAKRTRDFQNWEDVTDRIAFPENAKHGSVITVDRAMVTRLQQETADYRRREALRAERLALPDSLQYALPLQTILTVNMDQGKPISDHLFGLFFEDINYAADGGLYAELIQNRDFEYDPEDKTGNDPDWNARTAWLLQDPDGRTYMDEALFLIDTITPVHPNNPHYAVLNIKTPGVSLINSGFDGIALQQGETYNLSLFAKMLSGDGGRVKVTLLTPDNRIAGETVVQPSGSDWQQLTAQLVATEKVSNGRLQLLPLTGGTYAFDLVSLFPASTFKNRPNGLRNDLAQTIADLTPQFLRFPGGCVAHGDGLHNMYQWKNSIGPLEARKPMRNIWGYHQTQGLGYFEYFQFCEDIGAAPVPIIAAGVCCQNSRGGGQQGIPLCEMDHYIQDMLDLVEYANGDTTTIWGKKRAEAGHPAPFNLKYIGIGNEDQITDQFEERFTLLYKAMQEKHPEITVISTAGPFNEGTDYVEGWKIVNELQVPVVDEHYYQTPGWFLNNQSYYDQYDRKGAKVYLGEYAAHLDGRPNNLEVALAEAAYMTALERNGDVVCMASYAPMLAKTGRTQWAPDMIYFTNETVSPSVNYYVQQLFSCNAGDAYLHHELQRSDNSEAIVKRTPCSVVRDTESGALILKLLNILPEATETTIRLEGWTKGKQPAEVFTLSGELNEEGLTPQQTVCEADETFQLRLAPNSLTVVRIP